MTEAHICACLRTPIGPYAGAPSGGRADDLAALSGARLPGTATLELTLSGRRRAAATLCVGLGQGVSIALEAV